MKNPTTPFATQSDTSFRGTLGSGAFSLTNSDELERTKLEKPRKDDLDQALDDDTAKDEENDELEEEEQVEEAARANLN